MKHRSSLSILVALALASLPAATQAPLRIEAGQSSLKFGVLLQPQFESAGHPTREGSSQNLFLRRTRFIVGGTFLKDFELFLETDLPNLGKSDPSGAKTLNGLNVQDAVLTYKLKEDLRVDAGLILVPGAHQSNQGATTLNGLDYSPYAFAQTGLLNNSLGRDTGFQLRGLAFGGHLEFKGGVFQGKRDAQTPLAENKVASRNPLRAAARIQVNLFDAETGIFYAGTYGGTKRILSFGAAHDRQGDYASTAFDAFFDWPLGSHVLTLQANQWNLEGTGAWLLPKRRALFVEGSWRIKPAEFAPLLRLERLRMDQPTATLPDEMRIGVGLAWWFKGHTSNLKAYWQNIKPEAPGAGLKSYRQINLQWQLFYF